MGLLDEFGAWLDNKRRLAGLTGANAAQVPDALWQLAQQGAQNVKQGVTDPVGLLTTAGKNLKKFETGLLSAGQASQSVMPEVRQQGVSELADYGATMADSFGPGAISAKQAKQIIKQTKKHGGSTTDAATGENPKHGYAVAANPPGGLAQNTISIEDLTPRDIMDFERRNRSLLKGRNVGTWNDNGTVYLDASEVVQAPFKARLEGQRRKQLAAWDLQNGKNEYPSLDPQGRMAMRDASDKTGLLRQDAQLSVPDGPEFWPWRVQHGGYEAAKDDKGWFVKKKMSEDEKKLQSAIKDAETSLSQPGSGVEVWPLDQLKRPTQQNQRLQYATRPKGVPEWISSQYGPEYEKVLKDAVLAPKNPNAFKFYWTGQLQDDYNKIFGPTGQDQFQQLASNIGATTSGARPAANARMASYFDVRQNQGLPLPTAAPYPYGHNKSGTHLDHLRNLEESGGQFLPPQKNPKASTFSGNISGQTSDPTIDEVMTTAQGLVNGAGKPQMAPFDGTYDVPVDVFRKVTGDLKRTKGKLPPEVQKGLLPMDVQSAAWAQFGGDPTYAKPLLEHISDRINVTAKVTGMPVDVVKDLFLRKQIPLLSMGGFGLLGYGGEPEQ